MDTTRVALLPTSGKHTKSCLKNKKRAYGGYRKPLILLVGMARFERAASASRTLRSSQAEPHPVEKGNISKTEHFGK